MFENELLQRLSRIRADLRLVFEETRDRDVLGGCVDGKTRLERVPAFSHRNFNRLRGTNVKLARKEAIRIIEFIEDPKPLKPSAREGLRPIELDRRLRNLRASEFWKDTAHKLKISLDSLQFNTALAEEYALTTQNPEEIIVDSLSHLIRKGYDCESIIQGVNIVYDRLKNLPSLPCNDVGPTDKWDDIMRAHTGCLHVLLDGNKVGGYWFAIAISETMYFSALHGDNINNIINEYNVDPMNLPGQYFLYIVDLFILPEYRDAGSNHRMLRSFTGHLVKCAHNRMFVEKIVANISSRSAEITALKLGFHYINDHQCHVSPKLAIDGTLQPTKIYELDLTDTSGRARIFDFDEELSYSYIGRQSK